MDQNLSSLEYDNCRDLTHAPMLMQCFIHVNVNFEKKVRFFLWEISVFCTSQKYDNVTTPYYPAFNAKWKYLILNDEMFTWKILKLLDETSMASRSIICQRYRLRQIIDLRTRLGGQDNLGGRVVSASGKNCPWIYALVSASWLNLKCVVKFSSKLLIFMFRMLFKESSVLVLFISCYEP